METKSFLTSVTFWGLVITMASPILSKNGITLPGDTSGMANDIVTIISGAVALWGRWRADTPLHLIAHDTLFPPNNKQGGFVSYYVLPMLIAVAVVACTTTPKTPAQIVYAAEASYAGALNVAVTYKQLPPCEAPAAPVLCSRSDVVSKLRVASDVAFAALQSAEATVRAPGAGLNAQTAVQAAESAVQAFLSITSTLAVK